VALADRGERALAPLLWGFSGAAEPGRTILNARIETAAERPSFREALARRRCLVPATGFYEWRRQGSGRAPYHLHLKDEPVFAMAGLWHRWPQANGAIHEAFVVLTTAPNELVASIHDRMPVILDRGSWSSWLGPEPLAADDLARVARPIDAGRMSMYPVSSRVNGIRFDDPQCLVRVPEPPDQISLF
jgi:putative SOS response-associated peptidase YedK